MDNFNPRDTTTIDVFMFYNRPLLYSCFDQAGRLYLALLTDESALGERWLFARLSAERLELVAKGRIDTRAVFAGAEDGFVLEVVEDARGYLVSVEQIPVSDLTDDLIAVEIKGLEWLISCPKFTATAFDERGYPVDLIVPDPRAFCLHKLWLSEQLDRSTIKRNRDREQSEAVFDLIVDKMPNLSFADSAINAMPFRIKKKASYDFGFNL
jgi:hypothetical protein